MVSLISYKDMHKETQRAPLRERLKNALRNAGESLKPAHRPLDTKDTTSVVTLFQRQPITHQELDSRYAVPSKRSPAGKLIGHNSKAR